MARASSYGHFQFCSEPIRPIMEGVGEERLGAGKPVAAMHAILHTDNREAAQFCHVMFELFHVPSAARHRSIHATFGDAFMGTVSTTTCTPKTKKRKTAAIPQGFINICFQLLSYHGTGRRGKNHPLLQCGDQCL